MSPWTMYSGMMLITRVMIPGKIPAMFPMRVDRLAKSITDGSMRVVMVVFSRSRCIVDGGLWSAHSTNHKRMLSLSVFKGFYIGAFQFRPVLYVKIEI